jgi:hypothetical protein
MAHHFIWSISLVTSCHRTYSMKLGPPTGPSTSAHTHTHTLFVCILICPLHWVEHWVFLQDTNTKYTGSEFCELVPSCGVCWAKDPIFPLFCYDFRGRANSQNDWNWCAEYSLLTLWRQSPFFLNFCTPVFKIWIIQEPNKVELWNKQHFEQKRTGIMQHV